MKSFKFHNKYEIVSYTIYKAYVLYSSDLSA